MKKKVLVMESEEKAMEILAFALTLDGYSVIKANDGLTGLGLVEQHQPDLIILDLLPPMDSAETCWGIREAGDSTPVLVFTSPKDKMDKAAYKKLGATDCIDQPFAMSELLMKVKINTLNTVDESGISSNLSKRKFLGRIMIDCTSRVVFKDGTALDLSPQEYDLIYYLASNPGQIFSRKDLLKNVWGYTGYSESHIHVAILRLRKKIEDDPTNPSIILTRRGKGYYFAL